MAGCPLVILVISFAWISVIASDLDVKYNDFPAVGNIQASFHSKGVCKLGQFQIFISVILKAPLRNAVFKIV